MSASDLLETLRSYLCNEDSKLLHLPRDFEITNNHTKDVSVAHLKCSILVTASIRASQFCNETGEQELRYEKDIKQYLLGVISADGEEEIVSGVLWLCLHAQRCPFLTDADDENYLEMLAGCMDALTCAAVNTGPQALLESILDEVSQINWTSLEKRLQEVLIQSMQISDVDDMKEYIRSLRILAINLNTPELSRIMGWSSSGSIYICADHGTVRGALAAIAGGSFVSHAKLIMHALVLHEGGHCVVRKRVRETGHDPTMYSTLGAKIMMRIGSEQGRPIQCSPESGYILETIVYGAVVNPVRLWMSRKFHPIAPDIPLHGLCGGCCCSRKEPALVLPLVDSKSLPAMGFSCTGKRCIFK